MNYYEELGVSRSASNAEIRQAYKALVRVLHPDQQQEEDLRRVSELQLRRLNHMLQVLSDPLQRRQYDLGLDRLLPVLVRTDARQKLSLSEFRGVRIKFRPTSGSLVWLLIAAIAIATGIFWFRSPEPVYSEPARASEEKPAEQVRTPPVKIAKAQPAAPVHTEPAGEVPVPAGDSTPDYTQRDKHSVVETPSRSHSRQTTTNPPPLANTSRSGSPAGDGKLTPEPLALAAPAPAPKETSATIVAAAPKVSEHSVSGKWLYVPQHDETKKGLYPPEYIEMRITRRAGLLQGRYHAKYRVSDRPISSEVNFQFEGKQGDAVSVMPWFGNNGSRGELLLKRISDDSLEVNWVTTSFGKAPTLASGTAVLYRSE